MMPSWPRARASSAPRRCCSDLINDLLELSQVKLGRTESTSPRTMQYTARRLALDAAGSPQPGVR
jgi:hypothetical protein